MKLLLIGNYAPDAQQSMLRFENVLAHALARRGYDCEVVRPRPVFLRAGRSGGLAKWLGYVDKYLLAPREIARRARGCDIVHVLDHSNAVYVPRQPTEARWVATCHDLLAVRGALGEDTDCPASALGRRLQSAILAGLQRASAVACDSTSTLADFNRLAPNAAGQNRRVILLGPNHPYRPIEAPEARRRLAKLGGAAPWAQPFLLHVGSNLSRKNKAGVLRVFERVSSRWSGNLIFCGADLTPEIKAAAAAAGLAERVFAVPAISNDELEAAYSSAHALVFPSKCEGFGWPVLEAQACGCPVICSDRTSLPEVAGKGGLVFALDDEAGMAEAVLRLNDVGFRTGVVARGLANVAQLNAERMIDQYCEFYAGVLAAPRRST